MHWASAAKHIGDISRRYDSKPCKDDERQSQLPPRASRPWQWTNKQSLSCIVRHGGAQSLQINRSMPRACDKQWDGKIECCVHTMPSSRIRSYARQERDHGYFRARWRGAELPGQGRYWIAENASVIGRVRLSPMPASGSARSCAATTSGSSSASVPVQDNATLHTDPGFPLCHRG